VFGSYAFDILYIWLVLTLPPLARDICTCKPYLTFAIEECIRTAQRGGVGLVVYFRKEGRALGEVTK
jgi:GTP cyclohydrolase II